MVLYCFSHTTEKNDFLATVIENNHENTHEVSVKDKSEKHEIFYGLFRGFVLS